MINMPFGCVAHSSACTWDPIGRGEDTPRTSQATPARGNICCCSSDLDLVTTLDRCDNPDPRISNIKYIHIFRPLPQAKSTVIWQALQTVSAISPSKVRPRRGPIRSTLNLTPRASHSKGATGKRKAPKSIMKTSKKRKTPGGSYLATFTGSVQKTKKKNTLFISVPQVHEFQTDSPVTFRLPTSSKKSVEKMDANECDKVLEFMGKKSNITSPTKKKRAVLKVATDSLKDKLSYLGIVSPTDDLDELKNRVEFLKKLERQAHLRYAVGEDLTTYSVESLAMQLLDKKEKVQQVDARREILEDRLAAALSQESDNFRGQRLRPRFEVTRQPRSVWKSTHTRNYTRN